MSRIRLLAKLAPASLALVACGGPNFAVVPSTTLPEKWTSETLWKTLGAPKKTGLSNFHYDSGQQSFFSTVNGSLAYSQREAPSGLALIGESGFTGNGGDFSWEATSKQENLWEVNSYRLHFNNIPVDSVEVKKVISPDGSAWVNGQVPEFALTASGDVQTDEFLLSAEEAKQNAPSFLQEPTVVWSQGEATYFAGPSKLTPAWKFVVSAKPGAEQPSVPTEILLSAVSGEVLKSRPLAAHAWTGAMSMYNENKTVNTSLTAVSLPYLKDSQTGPQSDYWKVKNCSSKDPLSYACAETASATGSTFSYAWSNNAYDEMVAYHAVASSWDWNKGIMGTGGTAWSSNRETLGLSASNQLTIYVRALARSSSGGTTYDNAQYLPGGLSGTSSPAIVIGTGWEVGQLNDDGTTATERTLRYLGKDADVTMHEFHHHIIFRSLTSTSGETGAMHEGLADFLTYSITGNNKLGESIVPSTYSKGALRAGNVSGTISNYIRQPSHIAGEFWSTVLWDVRTALGTNSSGKYKSDKIVWDAIDLSVSAETYYGFISAMGKAADAYAAANGDNATVLRKAMFQVFADRGFLASSSLDGSLPAPGSGISSTSGSSTSGTVTTTRSSKSGGICGVVANGKSTETRWTTILFLLVTSAVPLAFAMREITAPQKARNRSRRNPSQFQ